MINLIPPTAQKEVKREYWIRVASVWLLLFGVACAVGVVLYIPTYVLIQSQLVSYTQEFEQINTENAAFRDARNALAESNAIAMTLGRTSMLPSFTEIIGELERNVGAGINLSEYQFSTAEGLLTNIEISGTAVTRSDLTAFAQSLSDDVRFSKVDLPLSHLAHDRNISFSLTALWANE